MFSERNFNEEPPKKLKAAFSCPALGCTVEFQKEGQRNAHWKKIHEGEMVVFQCPYAECVSRIGSSFEVQRHLTSTHKRDFPNDEAVRESWRVGRVPAVAEFIENRFYVNPRVRKPPPKCALVLPTNCVQFDEKEKATVILDAWLAKRGASKTGTSKDLLAEISELRRENERLRACTTMPHASSSAYSALATAPLTRSVVVYPTLTGNLVYSLNSSDLERLNLRTRKPLSKDDL